MCGTVRTNRRALAQLSKRCAHGDPGPPEAADMLLALRARERINTTAADVRMHPTVIALTVYASCVRWRTASGEISTYALPARTHEQAEGWRFRQTIVHAGLSNATHRESDP